MLTSISKVVSRFTSADGNGTGCGNRLSHITAALGRCARLHYEHQLRCRSKLHFTERSRRRRTIYFLSVKTANRTEKRGLALQSLVYEKPGVLEWRTVADVAVVDPTDALVEPLAVALCDLDLLFVHGYTAFAPPFPIGHECVARVVKLGADVANFRVGDVVVVPFQISCGQCERCLAGFTAHCLRVQHRTAGYGFGRASGDYGGALSDLIRVPFARHMLVRLPAGMDPVAMASCSDNLSDGWRTVVPYLSEAPGSDVLIVAGAFRSIGLYAAAFALHSGARRVDYVDTDPKRLELAAALGANVTEAIASLQRVGVNIVSAELGLHAGRGRRLRHLELLEWATWVQSAEKNGIANKTAFAASKVRLGFTVGDAFPDLADRALLERELQLASAQKAEAEDAAEEIHRERSRRADALIASLDAGSRQDLRAKALSDPAAWIGRNVSADMFDRLVTAVERRLMLDETQRTLGDDAS